MRGRERPIGNCVTIDIEIAAEGFARFKIVGAHELSAVVLSRIIPAEGLAEPVIHSDIKIFHDEDWRLETFSQIER